jgi:plastocyanin
VRGQPQGTTAGQFEGVQLWSGNAPETADVRTYRQGHTPVYDTEFVENDVNTGAEVFSPAGVAVRPGNVVYFDLTANSSVATLQITNLSTGQHAFETETGFVADGRGAS